ncbi:MAG: hypothetical protein SGI77_00060 [Pirellulaceae bacterium]|nr:hypothetical protein [Pirellulaceae bacterium]
MARERSEDRVDDFGKRPVQRPKGLFRKRNLFLGIFSAIALAVGVGGPMGLSNREFVVSTANKYAGIAPFKIDIDSIAVGWFSPLKIRGFRLIDQAGDDLVKVAELDTELGLVRLARNYQSLGTITIRGAQMLVDVQPGTTSVEEALKPLLSKIAPSSTDAASIRTSNTLVTGRIRIENAVMVARDSVDLSTWKLTINDADIPLPSAEQKLPPISLDGAVQRIVTEGGNGAVAEGRFTIRTQSINAESPNGNSIPPMQMTIATNGLPLEWYSLVHRRFPAIPLDQLKGSATVQADISMMTPTDIQAKIATAQIDQLSIVAPQLVGNQGAALRQVRLSGNINMVNDRLTAENAILESDIGALGVAASIPTAFTPPSATQPWIANAQWNIQGNIDIAKLLRVAPGMVPMQENTELTAGKATLSSVQTLQEGGRPKGEHRIQLGGLVANVSGSPMKWENALKASVSIEPNAAGQAKVGAECEAEFCSLKAEGDLQDGNLTANVDLDKLHQRLSKWFAIPIQQLSGNANFDVAWKQEAGNRIAAQGSLTTTPMRIVMSQGRLNEPAWKGEFQAIGTLDRGSLLQIDRGTVSLDSETESLQAELHEPLLWSTPTPGAAPLPPASMTLKLAGDMAAWQRRSQLLASFDPGMSLEGRCELQANGAIDMQHLEITGATFSAQPLTVSSPSFRVREARVEGTFSGRVDTNDIARLQVEKLLVQAESFALTAKDSASLDGVGREGKAAFRIEPKRMMSAIAMGEGANAAPLDMAIEGDITGNASWMINPSSEIRWQLALDGKNVQILQKAKAKTPGANGQLVSTSTDGTSKMEMIWEEAIAKASVSGTYDLKTGQINIPETTVQTVWMAYGGATSINSTKNETQIMARGQVTYDAATVADKIRPWTGDYFTVSGQRTEPVEVTWTSTPSSNWAQALQAKTQLGWDAANIVGIEIGKAVVPLSIENGQFRSKTEIPVSQGALRWNLDGDVGGDPIIIRQASEIVLENVAITPQMCQGWLKFVAPLVADVTSVQGQLSLQIDRAEIIPTDSLRQTIAGELQVKGATVGPGPLTDQLLAIVQQIKALRKGAAAQSASQSGSWLQMPEQRIQFNVYQGRVAHKNLKIQAGDIVISTEGSVGIDGQIELTANVPIMKEWVDGTPALASLAGQNIQFPIRGSLQKPKVDFQAFTSIGRQVAESAVQGAIQKQFDKGLNKLLGPLEKQLAPLQQGIQQNLPQFPQLPGGFQIPGFGGGAAPAPVLPPQ